MTFLEKYSLEKINSEYEGLNFEERLIRLYNKFDHTKILVTSSFAATSAYFLHIISKINPAQKIHFINTGYHFNETIDYKNFLIEKYKLEVVDLNPDEYQHSFSEKEKLYENDPDLCCTVNKVNPLEEIKVNFEIWMSSLMSWQTENRSSLKIFEERRGIIKFNPMIDVSKKERDDYIKIQNLPFHPLVEKGFSSIGCTHCTVKGEGRSGRWNGKSKTECGLHL
jgi:phosphoadenosine phosphosulfate reductase